jgi:hypothetical protein
MEGIKVCNNLEKEDAEIALEMDEALKSLYNKFKDMVAPDLDGSETEEQKVEMFLSSCTFRLAELLNLDIHKLMPELTKEDECEPEKEREPSYDPHELD